MEEKGRGEEKNRNRQGLNSDCHRMWEKTEHNGSKLRKTGKSFGDRTEGSGAGGHRNEKET